MDIIALKIKIDTKYNTIEKGTAVNSHPPKPMSNSKERWESVPKKLFWKDKIISEDEWFVLGIEKINSPILINGTIITIWTGHIMKLWAIIIGRFRFLFSESAVSNKVVKPRIGIIEIKHETMMLCVISIGVKPCLNSAIAFVFNAIIFII